MKAEQHVIFAARWRLPTQFGNCGTHPLFRHLEYPPTSVKVLVPDRRGGKLLTRLVNAWKTHRKKAHFYQWAARNRLSATRLKEFIATRKPRDDANVRLPQKAILFHPSVMGTIGIHPWIVEIEDIVSLFFPFIQNGQTHEVVVRKHWVFPFVKHLVEDDSCKAILTHVRTTADGIRTLFHSDRIGKKVFYLPASYVPVSPRTEACRERAAGIMGPLVLFFNNSWHQAEGNFYLRGGHYVLEAFEILCRQGLNLRLLIRSRIPSDLSDQHREVLKLKNVEVYSDFMQVDEYLRLLQSADLYLLPSARIHVSSLMEAMYYGLCVVASDGWGIREYVDHEETGFVVAGRWGKTSWIDPEEGFLREDYRTMRQPDAEFVQHIVDQVRWIHHHPDHRRQVAQAAMSRVRQFHSLEAYNQGFQQILNQILGTGVG